MNTAPQRAFALVTVLLALAVLTTVVVELQYSATIDAQVTSHARDKVRAYYLARSGYLLSQLRLSADAQIDRFLGGGEIDYLDESIWAMPLMLPMPKEILEAEVEKGNLTREMADQFGRMEDFGGQIVATIEDESAKINLNDLRQYQSKTTNYIFKVFEALLYQPQFMPYFENRDRLEFIDNLIDWIDENTVLEAYGGGGIEDQYYSSLTPQRKAKNMPFFSLAEVKLVREFDGELYTRLLPFITVFPYNIRLPKQEAGTINVNTAPREVLAALFSLDYGTPQRNLELAQQIMEYRVKTGPFKNGRDFATRLEKDLGVPQNALDMRSASQKLAGKSDLFRVVANGISNETTATIEAVIQRNRSAGTFNTFYYEVR